MICTEAIKVNIEAVSRKSAKMLRKNQEEARLSKVKDGTRKDGSHKVLARARQIVNIARPTKMYSTKIVKNQTIFKKGNHEIAHKVKFKKMNIACQI